MKNGGHDCYPVALAQSKGTNLNVGDGTGGHGNGLIFGSGARPRYPRHIFTIKFSDEVIIFSCSNSNTLLERRTNFNKYQTAVLADKAIRFFYYL